MVGLEGCFSSGFLRLPDLFQRPLGDAANVLLRVYKPIPRDFNFAPFREGIHNRDSDPMKAPGYLVGTFFELSTGMQDSHNYLKRRFFLLRMHLNRYPSSVILYRNAFIFIYGYVHLGAKSCKRFVNTVVYHFVHQVVHTAPADIAYVHSRSLANRIESL